MKVLRIATRKSALALWQANYVKQQLEFYHPQLSIELVELISQGDQLLDSPLAKLGGKGLFVKELESALLENRADIAVHSMKDVPMALPNGLSLDVICQREDPSDAFVSNHYHSLDALPQGAIVGTSSLRRQAQLLAYRPDLTIQFLRGNVNTRLAKLDSQQYDAIILASAGLLRLNMADRIQHTLATPLCLPAAGQGAIGIEQRSDDTATSELIAPLHHRDTAIRVFAERAMNRRLNGGCQVPIGVFATLNQGELHLQGLVANLDGSVVYRSEVICAEHLYKQAGIDVAEDLLAQGAATILATLAHPSYG